MAKLGLLPFLFSTRLRRSRQGLELCPPEFSWRIPCVICPRPCAKGTTPLGLDTVPLRARPNGHPVVGGLPVPTNNLIPIAGGPSCLPPPSSLPPCATMSSLLIPSPGQHGPPPPSRDDFAALPSVAPPHPLPAPLSLPSILWVQPRRAVDASPDTPVT